MALSSWLGFGKKKTSGEADSLSESKSNLPVDTDEFVVIERKPNPSGNMYPTLGPGGSAVSLPYQVQPMLPGQSALSPSIDNHPCNPLDDVPFKLSSLLVGGSYEWSRNEAAHFKSVVSRAVHHNETIYKYDFSHEKGIMRESNQGSVDVA